MDDLSTYLSQKDRIEALEKVVQAQEDEIKRLKRRNVEWKGKYYKLREKYGKPKPQSRSQKAITDIEQIKLEGFTGTVINQIRQIAKSRHLSVGHVTGLWYKSNKRQ